MSGIQTDNPTVSEWRLQQPSPYSEYQIPADWRLAAAHAQAARPGKHIPDKNVMCPCCFNYIQKQRLSYCEHTKQLAFLGAGFSLFYNFLKFCIVMLMALTLDSAIVGIVDGFEENNCSLDHWRRLLSGKFTNCHDTFANNSSFISNGKSANRVAIRITGFVAQLLLLTYFRDKQNKLAENIDERNCTMSDYSLYVRNIPKGYDNVEQRLRKLITENCQQETEVAEILLVENAKEYLVQESQLEKIVKQLQKAIQRKKSDEVIADLRKAFSEQQKVLERLGAHMKANQQRYFQGEAFIVMNTDEQKLRVIDLFNNMTIDQIQKAFPLESRKPKLQAQQAHEPMEILWKNLHYSRTQKYLSVILGWLAAILFTAGITVGFFFLIKFKGHFIEVAHEQYIHDQSYQTAYNRGVALGYLIVILINLLNKFVFSVLLHKFTDYEKHLSTSASNFSFALKYALCMFFTTALMTLIVEAIIYTNYTGTLGVVEEQHFMFIFNAYFTPFVWLVNPYGIANRIKQWFRANNNYYTQRQANELMQLPEYSMGKRYAEVIKTIWFTFLYVQLIPLGAIYSLTGLILYYFVDKYFLIHRSSVKDGIAKELSGTMITVLEFTLVLKPIGELIFDRHLRDILSTESIVMLCIGVVYMCLPTNRILWWINNEKFKLEEKTFAETKSSFPLTYSAYYYVRNSETVIMNSPSGSTITYFKQIKQPTSLGDSGEDVGRSTHQLIGPSG